MNGKRTVVVVGGGVIGASCAHFLNRDGWEVTVVDQGKFGGGCSHGNCGYVCPSHILPLAEPGAVRKALNAMLRPNSPFSIRFRFDPALWGWLLGFARRCNEADMMSAGRALQPLLESSKALYRELVDKDGVECEWEEKGLLYVYRDAAQLEAYEATNKILAEAFNHPARRLDARAALEMEPALKPGIVGAWYFAEDAHLRPDRLMASWKKLLEQRGVAVREGCEVHGLETREGRGVALETAQGPMEADAFVFATGAWTPRLSKALGCKVRIQPGKGYSITMPRPANCPGVPLIFPETRVAVTPMKSGYRLGSTMEFAGYDSSLRPERLELLRAGARDYLREPTCEPVEESWCGWRPMTCDGVPVIGPVPGLSNVVVAAGHNMIGMSAGPGTGKLVAELLGEKEPHLEAGAYAVR